MIEPSLANLKLDPPAVPAGKTIITYVFYYEYNQVLKDMKQNINLIDSVDHAVTSVEDVDPPVLGLNAVRIYDDPFNGKPHVLVSCEWDRCFYTFSKVIRKMKFQLSPMHPDLLHFRPRSFNDVFYRACLNAGIGISPTAVQSLNPGGVILSFATEDALITMYLMERLAEEHGIRVDIL